MARYWAYLNGKVQGPYELDELIRVSGFSRQTQISVDEGSGSAPKWISPAEIPELARIFKKVDELHEAPVPSAPPRAAPKPARPRMPQRLTPVPPPVEEAHRFSGGWIWLLIFATLIGGGLYRWNQVTQKQQQTEERQAAQTLIETTPLPSTSLYSTLRQYLQTQQVSTRWEFERTSSGLYNVTLSWLGSDKTGLQLPVYAFEANLQAQSVRGLNTAAIQLFAEGFPAPKSKETPPHATHRSPSDLFPGSINDRRQAFEQGDFETVWDDFSKSQRDEMEKGGMSKASFIRLQTLTRRMNTGLQQTILKTKVESNTTRLVLIRQTQSNHPDIYIKQRWVWEDNEWRLDDEEKKAASETVVPAQEAAPSNFNTPSEPSPQPTTQGEASPAAAGQASPPPSAPSSLPNLPGLSDPSSASH